MNAALQTQTKVPTKPFGAAKPSFAPVHAGLLQRKCACGGSAGLTSECEDCDKEKLSLQRSTENSGPTTQNPEPETRNSKPENQNPASVPPIVHEVLNSPGQPLDAETRAFMEPRFGHDFSHIRIHTDAVSANAASAVGARAYTVNRDIVFGAGEYAPHTEAGRRLLSHELMHVMQQRDGNPGQFVASVPLVAGDPDDRTEDEANHAADEVMLDGGFAPRPSSHTSEAVIRRQLKKADTPKGPEGGEVAKAREAKAKEALENKDGQAQVWLMIAPLLDKTYSGKALSSEQEIPESTGTAAAHSFGDFDQFDPAAVKDCFAIVGKLTEEARQYLDSEGGKALLKSMDRHSEGHALWLFARYWRASYPVVTKGQMKEAKQLETLQKHLGKKLGKPTHEFLKEQTSEKSVGDQVVGPAVKALVKGEKDAIDAHKLNDPSYATAEQDIKDLEKIREIITGMEDDALKLKLVKWVLGKASDAAMNPYILKGFLIALTNPTAVKTTPGPEKMSTPAESIIDAFMNKKAEQKIPVSFGKSTTMFQGSLGVGTNPVAPSDVLSGKDPLGWGMVKSLSGDLTGRFGRDRPLTVTAKDEFTFPPLGTSGPLSSKGSAEVDFKNKKAEKNFTGKTNYEFKPGVLTLSGSQKFADKKDFITFSEGYAEDQNGTRTTFGVDVKSDIFKQRFNLNLAKNAAGQTISETANLGLGGQFPRHSNEKSKTLSLDADITLNLVGKDYVKALSSFLEYKDPKDFLNIAIGYQRERSGQIQKEDFALALKKTWDDVSIYLGASFGMNQGKPARGDVLAGTEIMFGNKSKYGGIAEVEYNRSDLPGSRDTFTASAGLVRDKLRLAAYLSNNPANQFGIKGSVTFDPATWIKKKR